LPVVPDFIVEVRSNTDSLKALKDKMQEWIENGVRLAWLIDKSNEQTFIYRSDGTIEKVVGFNKKLSGEMS
jgi:Uma2 family endonuclease